MVSLRPYLDLGRDKHLTTPLLHAVLSEKVINFRDVTQGSSRRGNMASGLEMHEAAATGDYDSLEEYLKSGKFDVNLKDEDWSNRTALHWACAKGYVECIRLLLDHGAQGTAVTETGWTPAHFAAETGKLTVLRALHNAGISIIKKDNYGDRPKRLAEIYGHEECVHFLEQCEEEEESRDGAYGDFSRKFHLRNRLRSIGSSSKTTTRPSVSSLASRLFSGSFGSSRTSSRASVESFESVEDEIREKRLASGSTCKENSDEDESRES